MNMISAVLCDIQDHIAHITFNRPDALNAIDRETAEKFEEIVLNLIAQPKIRVVTLTGSGRAFMAGGDLAAFHSADDKVAEAEAIIAPMNRALSGLHHSHLVSLAMVQGVAAGAGLSLVAAADFAIASEKAAFSFAYLKIGASADCGITWALPRILGLRRALWLAIEGSAIKAPQALEWGLVTKITPPEELLAEGYSFARHLAAQPPLALANVKKLLLQSFNSDFDTTLAAEKNSFKAAAASQDFAKAIEGFFTKQSVQFSGT